MNIGIDLDGVVFDTESYYRAYADFFDFKHNGKGRIVKEELKVQKGFDWSKELFEEYINDCLLKAQEEAPFLPLAKESLEILRKNGHKLIAITARGALRNEEIDVTHKRIEKDELKFDKIFFGKSNKLSICQEEKIDLMIDDNFDNVDFLSKNGIKCLYFRDLILKFCENENVIEVNNWGDILREIDKFQKIIKFEN